MNRLGNEFVYATAAADSEHGVYVQKGLTKREYFAGLAMQGLLSNPEWLKIHLHSPTTQRQAVIYADALLKELEKSE